MLAKAGLNLSPVNDPGDCSSSLCVNFATPAEAQAFIKKNSPQVKVIMLTAFADLKNAIESKKLGAEDFISKPYDLVDLLTTIERVLSE